MLEDTEVETFLMDDPLIFKDVYVYLGSDDFNWEYSPRAPRGVTVQDFKYKVIPDA